MINEDIIIVKKTYVIWQRDLCSYHGVISTRKISKH